MQLKHLTMKRKRKENVISSHNDYHSLPSKDSCQEEKILPIGSEIGLNNEF